MPPPRKKLGEILLAKGFVSPTDVEEALRDQSLGEPSRLGDLLVAEGKLTATQLAQALAEQYAVPFTNLPTIAKAVLDSVPTDFQRQNRLVPIKVIGKVLSVAMADLANADAIAWLKKQWTVVKVLVAPGDEIDAFLAGLDAPAPIVAPKPSDELTDYFADLGAEAPAPAAPAGPSGLFDLVSEEGSADSNALFRSAAKPQAPAADPEPLAGLLEGMPEGDPVPPLRDDSLPTAPVIEPLAIPPPEPARPAPKPRAESPRRAPAAAPPTKPHAQAKPSPARGPVPSPSAPRQSQAVPAPASEAPVDPAGDLDLPAWLQGEAAASAAPSSTVDRWSGELEVLAPSKLATAVAKALIRRGVISEQDVLDALEQKKS